MASDTVHVKFNWDRGALNNIEERAKDGMFRMAFDIASNARARAPYLTGALSNSIRVQDMHDGTIEIIAGGSFGGKRVDYALIREHGPNRLASTEHYMQRATEDVMGGDYLNKYFGDITK